MPEQEQEIPGKDFIAPDDTEIAKLHTMAEKTDDLRTAQAKLQKKADRARSKKPVYTKNARGLGKLAERVEDMVTDDFHERELNDPKRAEKMARQSNKPRSVAAALRLHGKSEGLNEDSKAEHIEDQVARDLNEHGEVKKKYKQ